MTECDLVIEKFFSSAVKYLKKSKLPFSVTLSEISSLEQSIEKLTRFLMFSKQINFCNFPFSKEMCLDREVFCFDKKNGYALFVSYHCVLEAIDVYTRVQNKSAKDNLLRAIKNWNLFLGKNYISMFGRLCMPIKCFDKKNKKVR